jgi:hypothetical protein
MSMSTISVALSDGRPRPIPVFGRPDPVAAAGRPDARGLGSPLVEALGPLLFHGEAP